MRACSDRCTCLGCANPYGNNTREGQRRYSTTGTRKRRAPEMSSETTSGKAFMSKKPHPGVNSQWTFFEELVLTPLIQLQFSESDIDMAAIHLQLVHLVTTSLEMFRDFWQFFASIFSPPLAQFRRKVG